MKKIRYLFVLFLFIMANAAAGNNPADPRASFDSIWVDYGVKEEGELGMKIHLRFSAYHMKEMDAYVAIYFEYNDDLAGFIKDKNKKFQSSEGDVAVYKSIKPAYDPAVYQDLQLFMPYSELDLEPGIYDLTMDAKLIFKQGGIIDRLTHYDFEYRKPGSPADVESGAQASASLSKLWIDYDVTEAGKKGMMIHIDFTASNLKDVDCYMAIYFEKKNGDKIEGMSSTYRSKAGQLAVYQTIKPLYPEAIFTDLRLFMPYSEVNLVKGKHDLKLNASLILKNGDMIKHLKSLDFWFNQP